MVRAERLRKRTCLLTLPNFTRDLSENVALGELVGLPTDIILMTYNRVGDGLFEPRTVKGGLTIDLYQGVMSTSIDSDRMLSLEPVRDNEMGLLTVEQVADYFSQIKMYLADQVKTSDNPTFVVVYAGESEKFRLAVDFISKLSSLANAAGKGDLVKFYLLTCNHDLGKKVRLTEPLYESGFLQSVVYQPGGACGGLTDLQTIAETALAAVPDQSL
jgi:hypothetical protein